MNLNSVTGFYDVSPGDYCERGMPWGHILSNNCVGLLDLLSNHFLRGPGDLRIHAVTLP